MMNLLPEPVSYPTCIDCIDGCFSMLAIADIHPPRNISPCYIHFVSSEVFIGPTSFTK